MRVLLSTYGSRGDVEPVAGLAARLRGLGADVRVSAPSDPELAALVDRAGVRLVPAFSPVREWVAKALENRAKVDLPRRAAEIVAAQFETLAPAAEGCDVIVTTGLFPSTAAARSVAERLGIGYGYAAFCPYFLPSDHHRPHVYPGHPHPPDITDNRKLWERDVAVMNAVFGGGANAHRPSIGLPPVANIRDHVFTERPLLASDPVLSPWRPTELRDVVQTGAWILPDERPLPPELLAFLEVGTPPVFVGFGSMPMSALKDAARVAVAAIRAKDRRAILLHGWAGIDPIDDAEDCFAVSEVNQQALFGRVAAIVHHGGARHHADGHPRGRAPDRRPQIADQPYWAGRVAALGLGVAHDGPVPSFTSLLAALEAALASETRERARAVAGMVRGDGANVAARLLLALGSLKKLA